jgi:hypothetical protein
LYLTGRLSLGEPLIVPLTADQAVKDKAISDFFAAQANAYQFFLVRLACSFSLNASEPITRAWVVAGFTRQGRHTDTSAKVIAMDPKSVVDIADIKRNVEGSVKIEYAGASISFGGTRGRQAPESELFIAAVGLGKERVAWEFQETSRMKIGGAFAFDMIVQAPVDKRIDGSLEATVEIRKKHFGIIPYRSVMGDRPSARFLLHK